MIVRPVILAALLACTATMAADLRTATLTVSKMDCAACPITVRVAIEKVAGVKQARVDIETRQAVVQFDPDQTTPEALIEATTTRGYPSKLLKLQ